MFSLTQSVGVCLSLSLSLPQRQKMKAFDFQFLFYYQLPVQIIFQAAQLKLFFSIIVLIFHRQPGRHVLSKLNNNNNNNVYFYTAKSAKSSVTKQLKVGPHEDKIEAVWKQTRKQTIHKDRKEIWNRVDCQRSGKRSKTH